MKTERWLVSVSYHTLARPNTYCEAKRQSFIPMEDTTFDIRINESSEAFTTKIKQLLSIVLFLLLSKTVLRLCDLEFALALQGHQANAQIGTT